MWFRINPLADLLPIKSRLARFFKTRSPTYFQLKAGWRGFSKPMSIMLVARSPTYFQSKADWRGFSKPMSIMLVVSDDCDYFHL
jgi:hypothetical protein